jgi:hypothetical protein
VQGLDASGPGPAQLTALRWPGGPGLARSGRHDADRAVEPAVGDDRRGEVHRGEQFQADPEQRRQQGRVDRAAPWHPSGQQEVHRPPEESCDARVGDQSLGNRAARADSPADGTLGEQDAEQDASSGEEAENVSPAAMLLAEDPLIDHLKGARHDHGADGGNDQGRHDRSRGMGGRGSEKLADDAGALPVRPMCRLRSVSIRRVSAG